MPRSFGMFTALFLLCLISEGGEQSAQETIPVVTSVRSFATQLNQEKAAFLWEGLTSHFVTIVLNYAIYRKP